jgi:hypothetical protein
VKNDSGYYLWLDVDREREAFTGFVSSNSLRHFDFICHLVSKIRNFNVILHGVSNGLVLKADWLRSGWSSVMEAVPVVFLALNSCLLAGVFLEHFFVEKVVLV